MYLKELLSAPAGQLIKSFRTFYVDYYEDGVKTNVQSPSFDDWPINIYPSTFLITNGLQTSGGTPVLERTATVNFPLIKEKEDRLKLVNRRVSSADECYKNLLAEEQSKIANNASVLLYEIGYTSVYNKKIHYNDMVAMMLLGDYFRACKVTTGSSFDRVYAKVLWEDKIDWLELELLSDELLVTI